MNTHDIELPPLPTPFKKAVYATSANTKSIRDGAEMGGYEKEPPLFDEAQMHEYARAAIEPYVKRIAELEAARFAYASEFPPNEDGDPDVGSIHENIRKLKAELEADRQHRGEPVLVGWAVGTTGGGLLHASKYTEQEARDAGYSLPLYRLAPQQPLSESDIPAESVAADFPVKGKLHGPLGWIANNTNPEPVKPHLTVKYDDKGDYLYICCDSNEPAEAEENDQGILLWRAYSDGRLVGVTIPNFIGPYIKPVKVGAEASVPSDDEIIELRSEFD